MSRKQLIATKTTGRTFKTKPKIHKTNESSEISQNYVDYDELRFKNMFTKKLYM